ncbi:MAG: glycosyltransferase family 2 protein [Deltaproteobacteria bacterium]|nr:glycosyltransferase family 2 protein [Deltaproteobacteria bacterium]
MAHNEEKVIQKAVQSGLTQKTPSGFTVQIVVVANGCSDRTEEIVKELEDRNPQGVVLVSIKDKGKTKAINRAIAYFAELSRKDLLIPYVIFLDADCQFLGEDVLINFINRFEHTPQLCAVGANCLPDVLFNKRHDLVSNTYRAISNFGDLLKINSISGMCYAIKYDTLAKINFPNIQFNEDMYVSSRLDGWFFRDKHIKVVFTTPYNLSHELKRRTRQEVSTQRYHQYYSSLKQKGIMVRLYEKPLNDDYRWLGPGDNHAFRMFFSLKGIKSKFFLTGYGLTRLWAKINAYYILKSVNKNQETDFWEVLR